jgi:hypothetical protein
MESKVVSFHILLTEIRLISSAGSLENSTPPAPPGMGLFVLAMAKEGMSWASEVKGEFPRHRSPTAASLFVAQLAVGASAN